MKFKSLRLRNAGIGFADSNDVTCKIILIEIIFITQDLHKDMFQNEIKQTS
jgi:hypothetical protein